MPPKRNQRCLVICLRGEKEQGDSRLWHEEQVGSVSYCINWAEKEGQQSVLFYCNLKYGCA